MFLIFIQFLLGTFSQVTNAACGVDCEWAFDSNVLTIKGTNMNNYTSLNQPWKEYNQDIVKIEIAEGMQSIGSYVFYGLINVMEITNCDAGTLYLLHDHHLHFKIMRNDTLNQPHDRMWN